MKKTVLHKLKPMPVSRVSNRHPIIVGHRGAAGVAPENTLFAFEAALQAGADGVEFDVQRTRDGHLVVFHDEDITRTTSGTGMLPDHTLAEMQALDTGSWFDPRFAGARIVTLHEFFTWMRENDMLMFLEMKEPFRYPGIEQQIIDTIRAFDFVDRVQVRSFYHAHLLEFHQRAPEMAISELWLNHLPWGAEVVYNTVDVMYGLCTEDNIAQFHEWSRHVTAWVVDDLDTTRQLRDWGIDGITTNDPAHILTLFETTLEKN